MCTPICPCPNCTNNFTTGRAQVRIFRTCFFVLYLQCYLRIFTHCFAVQLHIVLSGANKCNSPGHCLQLFVGVNCFAVVKEGLNFSILYADPKISILAVAFSTVCFNFNRFGLPLVNGKIIVGKQRKQLNMSVFLRYQKFSSILISAVNFTYQPFNFGFRREFYLSNVQLLFSRQFVRANFIEKIVFPKEVSAFKNSKNPISAFRR